METLTLTQTQKSFLVDLLSRNYNSKLNEDGSITLEVDFINDLVKEYNNTKVSNLVVEMLLTDNVVRSYNTVTIPNSFWKSVSEEIYS